MDRETREETFAKLERLTSVPMLLLTMAMIPILIIPEAASLPSSAERSLDLLAWFIWMVFLLEWGLKFSLTPWRLDFIKRNIPNLVIIALPVLEPLGFIRSLELIKMERLARLGAFFSKSLKELRLVLRRHKLGYALATTVLLVFTAAGLVVRFEKAAPAGQRTINTLADGLWWAVTTVTTIGYGDTYPITAAGRVAAVFLIVAGIVFFSLLTANIAAFLVSEDQQRSPEFHELQERLKNIETLLVDKDAGRKVGG